MPNLGHVWGSIHAEVIGAPATINMDGANHLVGVTFLAPKTGTIDRVVCSCTAIVGNPPPYYFAVVTLDANNRPTTNPIPGSAAKLLDFTGAGAFTATLDTPASVTRGVHYGLAIYNDPANLPDAANYARLAYGTTAANYQQYLQAYYNQGAGYANSQGRAIGAYYDDGDPVGACVMPATGVYTFRSTSAPNEYGALFTTPCQFTVKAAHVYLGAGSYGIDVKYTIYDSLGNVVWTWTQTEHQLTTVQRVAHYIPVIPDLSLLQGTYRFGVAPQAATDVALSFIALASAAQRIWYPEGANIQSTYRTVPGAWTDDPTALPFFGLRLSGSE